MITLVTALSSERAAAELNLPLRPRWPSHPILKRDRASKIHTSDLKQKHTSTLHSHRGDRAEGASGSSLTCCSRTADNSDQRAQSALRPQSRYPMRELVLIAVIGVTAKHGAAHV